VLKFNPVVLASSVTKSSIYFCHMRWNGRRTCIKCNFRSLYHLSGNRYGCKRCRYNFSDFTDTYLGNVHISINTISHILYLFALGVPAYRIRFYVSCNLSTIERTFRLFRYAIYNESLQRLKELILSGEIEIDEALFGGHKKGSKRGWGSIERKNLVFGIYKRNGIVITFPVSDRKQETLIPLIKQHTKKGSLYYSDDHTAYAILNMMGKHQVVSHGREEYVREDTHINGIEGFWSYSKTWLYHYRGVPKQYFHLYLKEIEFRFNNRNSDIFYEISKLVVKSAPTM
jgi:transposase